MTARTGGPSRSLTAAAAAFGLFFFEVAWRGGAFALVTVEVTVLELGLASALSSAVLWRLRASFHST